MQSSDRNTERSVARKRPMLHTLIAGAVLVGGMLGSSVQAQVAPPPRPARAGAAGDAGQVPPPPPPGARRRMPAMEQGMGQRMGPGMRQGMGPEMGPGGPGRPGAGGRGQGMRSGRGGGNVAARLLGMRGQLELTDDQVKRLEALQAAPAPQRNEADALRARADLMDAMRGDGNINAARTALDRMSRVRNEQLLASLKSRQDARNVLTASQKSKLDNMRGQARGKMRGQMRRRMQNGRQGGMPGGMQGGMQRRMQGGRPGMQGGMGPGFAPRGQRGMQPPMPPMPPRNRRGDLEIPQDR